MKRTLLATCLAGACAVALSAQTPTTQQPPTGTSGSTAGETTAQSQRGRPMTVSGCLREGDTAGTFMLTNIKGMGGRPGGSTGSTGGTTGGGTTGGTTAGTTGQEHAGMNQITLTPSSSVDLKPHVGHQIEVTGTMAGRSGQGTGTTGGTTTGGTTAGGTTGGTTAGGTGTSGNRGMRSMNVTAIKMISETCPSQQ